jgi:hypothetical protein
VKTSDVFLVSHLVNSLHRDYVIETTKPCGPSGAFEIDLHLSDGLRYALDMDMSSVPGLIQRFGVRFPGALPPAPH